ncbi:MAG: VIT1/CCC1 transporter family protein [Parvularculaceae bacterium]
MTASYLTAATARAENDPVIKALFEKLAIESEQQAALIAKAMETPPVYRPDLRARIVANLVQLVGPRQMRPILAAVKVRGISVYRGPALAGGHQMPTSTDEIGARHQSTGGGAVRAAVFGVNDGLISNTSLVMGMAGAATGNDIVFLTGVVLAFFAGAFLWLLANTSPCAPSGRCLSTKSRRRKKSLDLYPRKEAEGALRSSMKRAAYLSMKLAPSPTN